MNAACAGHPEPLWDAHLDGENEVETARRHARALAICRTCPMRAACAAAVDVKLDEGIRGGIFLPPIPDAARGSWRDWTPGRGGLAQLLKRRSGFAPDFPDLSPSCAETGGRRMAEGPAECA